ncbi:MAG: response regulator transcription factor [Weeksellaceae bacterium]
MKKILLVEDDEFLKQLYSDLLTAEKYTVTTATDGKEALNLMVKGGWDLVLLDVMLPNMTGFEILDAVKTHQKKLSFPVIFMTNLDSTDDDKKKLEEADAYWTKSELSPPDFVAKVQSMIG